MIWLVHAMRSLHAIRVAYMVSEIMGEQRATMGTVGTLPFLQLGIMQ